MLQGREGLISWVQEVLLDTCRVKMYPATIIPESSNVPHEPIPFYYNQARQSIPLVPYNRMQYQVSSLKANRREQLPDINVNFVFTFFMTYDMFLSPVFRIRIHYNVDRDPGPC